VTSARSSSPQRWWLRGGTFRLRSGRKVFFTKGRVIVRGKTVKRGEAKFADYLLYFKPNIPLGVVEAKDNNHSIGAGMPQALGYADKNALDLPCVFSSNGDGSLP
jgi:type I restriction enzyme R subunit